MMSRWQKRILWTACLLAPVTFGMGVAQDHLPPTLGLRGDDAPLPGPPTPSSEERPLPLPEGPRFDLVRRVTI